MSLSGYKEGAGTVSQQQKATGARTPRLLQSCDDGPNREPQLAAEGVAAPASWAQESWLTPRRAALSTYAHQHERQGTVRAYLVRALVEHLPCAGELLGVGRVLHPCGARGTRAARGQVSADWLLGHVVGQAGAAGAGRRRGAPVVAGRRNNAFYPNTKYPVLTLPT